MVLHTYTGIIVVCVYLCNLCRTGKSPVHALGPGQSLMYTWDVPHQEHMIRWWVQGEKKEKRKDQLLTLEVTHTNYNYMEELYLCK